jgi:hypothetical protein
VRAMPMVMDDEDPYSEATAAATSIQAAVRGRKARGSTVPRQRKLRTKVDKDTIRRVTKEEEARALVHAKTMAASPDWTHATVRRFDMQRGGQVWLCDDDDEGVLLTSAVQSMAWIGVAARDKGASRDVVRYRAVRKVILKATYDYKSASCGTVEIGETVRALEFREPDASLKKKPKKRKKTPIVELPQHARSGIGLRGTLPGMRTSSGGDGSTGKTSGEEEDSATLVPEPEPEPAPEPEPVVDKRIRCVVSGCTGWCDLLSEHGEVQLELCGEKPVAVSSSPPFPPRPPLGGYALLFP